MKTIIRMFKGSITKYVIENMKSEEEKITALLGISKEKYINLISIVVGLIERI
jgi:hypothetical protein